MNLQRTISIAIIGLFATVQSAGAISFGIPDVVDVEESEVATPVVQLDSSTPKTLRLQWFSAGVRSIMADTQSVSTVYQVAVIDSSTGTLVDSFETTNTNGIVRGLDTNTAYEVQVRAERDGVHSAVSESGVRTTPAKPRSLAATTEIAELRYNIFTNEPLKKFGQSTGGKYGADLEWNAPEGEVAAYKVKVYKKKKSGKKKLVHTTMSDTNSVFVAGLQPNARYFYRVQARYSDTYTSKFSKKKKFRATVNPSLKTQ